MKKKILISICLLLMAISLSGCKRWKDVIRETKTGPVPSLQEVESAASLIIIGTKEREIEQLEEHGRPEILLSEINVEKVIKGSLEEPENPTIEVVEWEVCHEDAKIREHISGYTKMTSKDRYLLFLGGPFELEEYKVYSIIGTNYGQVCITSDYRMKQYDIDISNDPYYARINELRKAALEKYRNMGVID